MVKATVCTENVILQL